MKGIIKIQAKKPTLAVSAFLVLLVLIWVMGGGRGWRVNTRLLAILIVVMVGVLLLLIKSIQAKRSAASLEQSIKSQAQDQMRSTRPEKKAEIEELQRELILAIESLKKSKLGRGRSGKSALYSLPWYMFIGPPAAGKTTAIINSGLEFSFGSDIKGVGGTRNCDWFFSNSTILLDTAGRYVTEDEDKEEWLAFLDILKKHRRRSPINGVIIGMSIADILKASLDELEWHARNIRRRIDELIQRLGIRFPVYLVITKLDLLQGFVETFEHLSRTEREQIWGCTLSPEQVSSSRPREVFEQEFDLLVRTLDDFRLKRLSLTTKPESRGRVYVFPLEFTGIKESVGQFIGKLFQPSPYQEVPVFRGFYFTSGTQEGVPIDRVIQAIAKQFDLPSELISEPEVQKKSYFIRRLFTDIIIPDRNLVAQTSRAATQKNVIRAGVIVGSLICLSAFIFGISQAYLRSQSSLKSMKADAARMGEVNWYGGATYLENLRLIDRFREKLVSLEEKEARKPLIRSGMSRSGTVLEAARKLYYEKSSPFIKELFFQELENHLKEYRKGVYYHYNVVWDYFKAYLLMGDESTKLDEPFSEFLKKELTLLFDEKVSAEGAEEIRPLVQRQLEYYIQSLRKGRMPPFENEGDLVQSIRARLNKPINLEDAYQRFRDDGLSKLRQPSMLSQILKGRHLDFVSSQSEVPEFFTRRGWEDYVQEAIEAWSQNPEKESWILGQAQSLGPDLLDRNTLSAGLRERYFKEYSRLWWQFLQSIRYAPFKDLGSASEAMKKLSDPKESPIRLILEAVARETRFGGAPTSKGTLEKIGDKAISLVKKSPGLPAEVVAVEKGFAKLHVLSPAVIGEGEISKELGELLKPYAVLNEKLQSIESEPGPKAIEAASPVLEREEGELPEAFRVIHAALPETDFDVQAREALFEEPLKNVWGVILKEVRTGLNDAWRNGVYQPYAQTLAPYYPFGPQGKAEAPLAELARFFDRREGIIGKFVDEKLKPFIKTDTWKPILWLDQGISLSPQGEAALEKAEEIRQALFATGSLGLNFSISGDFPEPVGVRDEQTKREIRKSISQISLDIDGNVFPYRMGGERWHDFIWPGTEGTAGARLTVTSSPKYSISPVREEGLWGWFRLLDRAQIAEATPTECTLRWILDLPDRSQVRIQYRLRTKSRFHPFRDPRSFFRLELPETLIAAGSTD